MPRVLMIGPGPGCKGGMAAVVSSYSRMEFWGKYGCVWIQSVDTRPGVGKLLALSRAVFLAIRMLPGSSLVHVHIAPHRSFYRKALFIWLARAFGRPVIAHIHAGDFGLFWSRGGAFSRRFITATLRSARLVIAVSGPLARDMRRCSEDLPLATLPNPFEAPAVFGREHQSSPKVLFAGRIERDKGVFDLITAFAQVRRAIPQARLEVAGEGRLAEAETLVEELGLTGAVEFPGWLTQAELAHRFASASVFCLPSYIEGMPVSVLQAMAAGVPVVATAVGGMCDLLQPDAGLVVAPGDISALSSQLIRVLGSEQLQRRIASAAMRALDAHTFAHVNECIEAVYEQLLERGPVHVWNHCSGKS